MHKLRIRKIGYKEFLTEHPLIPNYQDQHGCFDQIPIEHKHKPILSVIRDPYLRFESIYKFRWWVQNPPIENEQIEELFPTFPDLTFQQYIEMDCLANKKLKIKYGIDDDFKIGSQSILFIRMFLKNHQEILSSLDENYMTNQFLKKDICNVTFLKKENLNEELAQFLSKYGFSKNELNFIQNHEKVNVTTHDTNKSFLNQELIDYINEYEWVLFDILSMLDIIYKRV